ncbi:MAG: hypothetical protein ABI627_27400 [Polyangiaceae bacterium]
MPFTVLCPACDSRFVLGDDLFRRKVSGNIVAVKCRNCDNEISLDARDIDTMPSHESPQARVPHPPRPKGKTEPTAPADAAEGPAPLKPISAAEANSLWDDDATVSIGGKPPSEPEFLDFEEIPASSSDAPPLNTLTHHEGPVKPPRRTKPVDDFLVNLNPGTDGMVGAPTIDVTGLAEPAPPSYEEIDVEPNLSAQRAGTVQVGKGTIPLFDMSAVLPVANEAVKHGSSSAAPMHIDIDLGSARKSGPVSAGKPRERKFVVAPQDAPQPQKKRGGALIWLTVAAVAAGVVTVVGLHGHRVPEPAVSDALPVTTPAQPVTSPPTPIETPAAEAPNAAQGPSAEPSTSAAEAVPAAEAAPAAAPTSTTKSALVTKPEEPAQPKSEPAVVAAPVLEIAQKPADTASVPPRAPLEIHNAPPPAAAGTEFDRPAAVAALKGAATQASSCRKDRDPSGTAVLTITFAPSGRVTSATIQGPPFAGTPTGGCIANTMRHASIPAFDGERVTVTKTVVIE